MPTMSEALVDLDPKVEAFMRSCLSKGLGVEEDQIGDGVSLPALGLDSLTAVQVAGALEEEFGRKVDPELLFYAEDYSDIKMRLVEIMMSPCGSTLEAA